jgi:G3E family GTPase
MAEIPVTIVTGFLGAGKTTLLNHLLKQPELAGAAVLVNEFGEIGLDHLLVERLDEDTVLLNAGCLCCTVRGDLVRALLSLQDRPINRVVVETTGLADPVPIIQTLLADHAVALRYRLDGVVTVVDALCATQQMDAQPEAVKQIAVADRIVVSKSDLATPKALEALRARIHALNPGAPLIDGIQGIVPPGFLLEAGLFDPDGKIPDVRGWLNESAFEDAVPNGHVHAHAHHHDRNRHDSRIQAFCLTFEAPLHWQGFGTFLEMLIATRGENLLRVKGILNLDGQDRPVAVHGVQHVFHPPQLLPGWPEGDPRTSRIVFIVRDLDRTVIENGLRAFEAAA